jgi:hypothetical protein
VRSAIQLREEDLMKCAARGEYLHHFALIQLGHNAAAARLHIDQALALENGSHTLVA